APVGRDRFPRLAEPVVSGGVPTDALAFVAGDPLAVGFSSIGDGTTPASFSVLPSTLPSGGTRPATSSGAISRLPSGTSSSAPTGLTPGHAPAGPPVPAPRVERRAGKGYSWAAPLRARKSPTATMTVAVATGSTAVSRASRP